MTHYTSGTRVENVVINLLLECVVATVNDMKSTFFKPK